MPADFSSRCMADHEHKPGDHVAHPTAGPCRVVGVRADPAMGAALVLERVAPLKGRVLVPLTKLHKAGLRPLAPAKAEEMAATWERPVDRFNHVSPDIKRGRRIAAQVSLKKQLAGYQGAMKRWGGSA